MSDIALYRKHRPQAFSEVVGQDQVVSVLEAAVKKEVVSHAYLFSGTRGTGKTSVARIFAKALKTDESDIYEIDAASNRGIDEIRELREGVHSLPFSSKYKVYIIDEVHMLTTPAFNALLKTLEEPPKHVIFILATTEFHKLPETIVSRCQVFQFRKPGESQIRELLEAVAKSEKLKIDKESLSLMALLADGSYRDALGVLQKVVTFSKDKKIEIIEVEQITGAPKGASIQNLLEAILDGDLEKSLKTVDEVSKSGVDMRVFLKLLMRSMRFAMLLSYAPNLEEKISAQILDSEVKYLKGLSGKPKARLMSAILKALLAAYEETAYADIKQMPLELAIVKLLAKKDE